MSESPLRPVQPSLPELLEHATFLRRLAARLVGPEDAADIVQEAFATALARPPARASLRGWLAIVVANLARRERRRAARRATREEHVARPEHEDDSTLALERLDLQRALSAFVVALPEEQRTVLYLRYFEDLTPSAIAARLGVPLKTIESRHTRALASLRTKLDERSGGDRAAWVSALAAWAVPTGGAGMLVGAKVAAVFAAVVLGGWYLLRPSEQRDVPPQETVAVVASELEPMIAAPVSAGARETVSGPVAPPVESVPARLFGIVRRRADGSPLAEARVRVIAGELGSIETTTDALGLYAFEWRVPVTISQVEVLAGAKTTAAKQWVSETLTPPMSRELAFLVSAGGTLSGRVVDEAGESVPGAAVLGWCAERIDVFHPEPDRRVRAGNDGSFTVEHLGEQFVLLAEARGLTCKTGLRGVLADGGRAEGLTLELAPAVFLRGVVVDEQGRPLEGVHLWNDGQYSESDRDQTEVLGVRRLSGTQLDGRTGADGRFELGPAPVASVQVSAFLHGFLRTSSELRTAAQNRIVLGRGLTVSGRVLDSAGKPLSGARVRLGDCAGGRAETDADGRWSIGAQEPAESAYLLVQARGHAIEVREPLTIAAGMASIEVRLAPELVIAGRILDADGQPAVGAKLLLEGECEVHVEGTRYGERTTFEWAAGLHRATTDAEGRFRFESLNPGEFSLSVVPREGPVPGVPFRAQAGEESLEFVLDDEHLGVVFRGRVRDALDGRPLEAFTVTVWRPDGKSWVGKNGVFEGTKGEYELTGFAPGRHRLSVWAHGYSLRESSPREYSSGIVNDDVLLTPTVSVRFQLAEQSVDFAYLSFEELDGTPVAFPMGTGHAYQLQMNQDGEALAFLPRTFLRVLARSPRHAERQFELDLTSPPDEPVLVHLVEDPRERRRSFQLGVFVAADPAVRALKTLDELRVAFEQGELEWPHARVELEFLEADGTRYGQGTLEPLHGTTFRWSTTTPEEDGDPVTLSEEEQGPGLELELPARVTTIRLSGAGLETTLVEIETLLAGEAPVAILAPRR